MPQKIKYKLNIYFLKICILFIWYLFLLFSWDWSTLHFKIWSQYILLKYAKLIKSDSKCIYDVTKHFYIK